MRLKNSKERVGPFTRLLFVLCLLALAGSCRDAASTKQDTIRIWEPYDDATEVAQNADHPTERMRYKLIQSKVMDKNKVFLPLYEEVLSLSEADYKTLAPLVLEQDIQTLRGHLDAGALSYEQLVLFYLKRIYTYELDNAATLNTIMALNGQVVAQARALDQVKAAGKEPKGKHPIYGMPILLKDNINTEGMPTTAGSIALRNNETEDAFIVKRLKEHGALILGKVNLSEWAYFMCSGCPVGYSAMGGQTLNPYGRRIFETGGSSSGSGTAVAANYAVAAVGTETSGSILSPSSQNSVVGLKPTIGVLSRGGIVPISSTLDTPGPMTKTVADNAILLSAMMGKDDDDASSVAPLSEVLTSTLVPTPVSEMRLGVFIGLMERDSSYAATVEKLRGAGATIVSFTPPEVSMDGFISILNLDMKTDLPAYLRQHTDTALVRIAGVEDAFAFNKADSLVRIPYGQAVFEGILADTTSAADLGRIKETLERNGRRYFNEALDGHDLDAVLSMNNRHAGYAAVAKYPALTVPMGYRKTGEPVSLTFIGKPFSEAELLRLGAGFEQQFPMRKMPEAYR
ncbi:amidase family protein [Maribacter sp. 2307ULW6-5]|uniref:amidase family protein n=1 Tax=Maribacter sp. 2307ULW6-5 TaxID=3386275 RepID=UPI0039BC90E1